MIAERGPDKVKVIEPKGVPIQDVAESLTWRKQISGCGVRFNLSKEEIFECLQCFLDETPISKHDLIELKCDFDEYGELSVTTTRITDIVYLNCIMYGSLFLPEDDYVSDLYTKGIAEIMRDCLGDISKENDTYMQSKVHTTVFKSFEESYGTKIDIVEADILLHKMNDDKF